MGPIFATFVLGVAVSSCGDSDDNRCAERSETYTISGEIVAPSVTVPVDIYIWEETSWRCDDFGPSIVTPGDRILARTLEEPGPFALEVTVTTTREGSGSEGMPDLLFFAHSDTDGDGSCDSGAFVTLSPASHEDLEIELHAGGCALPL